MQNMAEYDKKYAEYEPTPKNMPKNQKIQKIQKYMSSQTRDYPHSHPGFENNIFCNIYAEYAEYAKYVLAKYVIYAKYAQCAKYVILVYNLGCGGMRFPAV
jgi:hypothetical protein